MISFRGIHGYTGSTEYGQRSQTLATNADTFSVVPHTIMVAFIPCNGGNGDLYSVFMKRVALILSISLKFLINIFYVLLNYAEFVCFFQILT
jgi:hypothetical protein